MSYDFEIVRLLQRLNDRADEVVTLLREISSQMPAEMPLQIDANGRLVVVVDERP